MTDISAYLMRAEQSLKRASEAICNGTMTTKEREALMASLEALRDEIDAAIEWAK